MDRKQEWQRKRWTNEQQQERAQAQREAWQREECWGQSILNLHQLETLSHPRAFNMSGRIQFDRFQAGWSAAAPGNSPQEPHPAKPCAPSSARGEFSDR